MSRGGEGEAADDPLEAMLLATEAPTVTVFSEEMSPLGASVSAPSVTINLLKL